MKTAVASILFGALLSSAIVKASDSSDISKDFFEIARENGFNYETHRVITHDGYILSVFRLPHPDSSKTHPPVLFQHGLMDSADAWIMSNAETSPAFMASKA